MKSNTRIKAYRDHSLYRDIGFLLSAVGFLLVQAFDQPLQDAVLYAPLIVAGAFGALLGTGYLLNGVFHAIDAAGERLGASRPPRR